MKDNLSRLREKLVAAELPAVLVSDMANVRWLTGFTGSYGLAIVSETAAVFISDGRYGIQSSEQVKGFDIQIIPTGKKVLELVSEACSTAGITNLGFEQSVTYATWKSWSSGVTGVELVPAPELFKDLRIIKTPAEIDTLRKACGIIDATMAHVVKLLRPGATELDLAIEVEFFIRRQNATVGFSPILVSGPNSAKPHGVPTEKKLEVGDFVTIDIGACFEGYTSDITRTLAIGEVSERQREMYGQVLKAQNACIDALKPGANGREIDGLARKIIDEKGLAKYFTHGLGHGIGLHVHDYGRLSSLEDQTIEAGQVWTVEPGVYIEGFCGVRIEDDVLVTPEGPEVLTHYPKELTVVG